LFHVAVADPDQGLGELMAEWNPVTVRPDAKVEEVASKLVESRKSSVVVVDDEGRPLGRILADDIIDVLLPDRHRFHFPRLLQ
jgi:Mg/Co/Ni transporter MgtE